MFDKLSTVEAQYEELMTRLGTAEVQSDPAEYRKAAKTLSEIEPLVQKYREYKAVQKAIEDAIKRIRACGKPAGILTPDETQARRYIEWGTTFTAVGLDLALLARESEKLAAKFKK